MTKSITASKLRVPFALLVGDGQMSFGLDDVCCGYQGLVFEPPTDIRDHIVSRVDQVQRILGFELTNEPAYRLCAIDLEKLDGKESPVLTLSFERTNYFDFVATNLSLDHKSAETGPLTLREKHVKDITCLEGSPLANILSVMILLISEPDDQVLLAKRSARVVIDPGRLQVSAGGAMRLAVDHDEGLRPSPFVTIQRELAEEIGVRLPLESVRFLGLGVDTRTGEPELLGLAYTHLSIREIGRAYKSARHGNDELAELAYVPYTMPDLANYLVDKSWCPGDWVCCYLALVNRYGRDQIEQRFGWQTIRGLTISLDGRGVATIGQPLPVNNGETFRDKFRLWRKRAPLPVRQAYSWGRRQLIPHYLWTHPEFERHSEWLQETETWPLEQHKAFQLESLKRFFEHAYANVPYYRQQFDRLKLEPRDIQGYKDLPMLPILTKRDVRLHLPQLVAENVRPEQLYYVMTGGTTGVPLGFYHQKGVSRPHEAAFMYRQWKWAGYRMGDRVALLRPYAFPRTDRDGKRCWWDYCAIDNSLLLSNYLMSRETLPFYLDKLHSFRPNFIQSFPSALEVVARYMLQKNVIDIRPKAIFTEFEQLYPAQRSLIEKAFGCPVLAGYGQSERTVDAVECLERSGYHVCMEYGVLEITDEDGYQVGPGEVGYITGTGLDTHCMPFIRYQTDDLARFVNKPCDCGRSLPLITDIVGRWQHEVVVTRDDRYIPVTTLNTHDAAFDHVERYQYFQETPGELVVRLVPFPSYTEADTKRIQDALLTKLHGEMEIQIVFVDGIPLTRRGKHRMLIQKLDIRSDISEQELLPYGG